MFNTIKKFYIVLLCTVICWTYINFHIRAIDFYINDINIPESKVIIRTITKEKVIYKEKKLPFNKVVSIENNMTGLLVGYSLWYDGKNRKHEQYEVNVNGIYRFYNIIKL